MRAISGSLWFAKQYMEADGMKDGKLLVMVCGLGKGKRLYQ